MTNIASLCMGCMKDMGDKQSCPDCGAPLRAQNNAIALPLKTILNNRFLVGRVLGKPGGFGITYLAWDMLLETTAAIKEFIPLSSVSRDPKNTSVRANSKQDHVFFKQGLQIFLKEAKTLAQFTHPNIVRIRDCFSSNNTAYLVMEYRQGLPLDQVVAQAGGRLSEDKALEIILPILDGLEAVHKKGFLHRDIKPQNIYLTDKGIPLLLDFGASRFALTDSTKTLTVMLSAGYAPFEQYHKKGNQGVWSDIYSIGATLYFMTTGKMPTDAIERQHDDNICPPNKHNPQLSSSFNNAILKAMSVNPNLRPTNISDLKQSLLADSHQVATFNLDSIVSESRHPSPSSPVKTTSRRPVINQHDKQTNSLSFGRILIYIGIVAVLWSGWSTRQLTESNDKPIAHFIMPSPMGDEDINFEVEILQDDYVETIELAEFDHEMEMENAYDEKEQWIEPQIQTQTQQKQAINPIENSQNPIQPELKPHVINQPMHPPIPEAAFEVCKNKRLRSRCKFNFHHGEDLGLCLQEIQGRLACMPSKPPTFQPPHPRHPPKRR